MLSCFICLLRFLCKACACSKCQTPTLLESLYCKLHYYLDSGAQLFIENFTAALLNFKVVGWKGWGEISYGGFQCVNRAKAAEFMVFLDCALFV